MSSLRRSLLVVLMAGLLTGCASPAATVAPTVTAVPTATPAPTMEPGDSERKVMVNEVERTYLLHIPPGLDKDRPVPVVFAFHGLGQEPATMELLTGFNDVANKAGVLVVYPEGLGLSWNAGEICCRMV